MDIPPLLLKAIAAIVIAIVLLMHGIRGKGRRAVIRNAMVSVLVTVGVALLVTELIQNRIYFSLFAGIPAGLLAGIVTFVLMRCKAG